MMDTFIAPNTLKRVNIQLSTDPMSFLEKFIELKSTGQITFNIKEGKIMCVDIRESIRVD